MKILILTDEKLVMKHQPTKNWLFGGFIIALLAYQLCSYLYQVFFIPGFLTQQRGDAHLIRGAFLTFLIAVASSGVSTPEVICSFDKSMSQVVIEYKSLGSSTVIKYSFADIQRADIEQEYDRLGQVGRPVLILKSLKTIPIHTDYIKAQDIRHDIYTINKFIRQCVGEENFQG
ncbi:hypothetical protein [Trichormus variabilis]|uniref:Uncharacterized protein n=1 Tax=Trichormus variabilis SAG 1403-4b TaxID=447716 RepID=A0A433UJI6_ANAVA|nr:hypothetical protein [Trichormus variabilis]MBD2628708.1 hypothetical protein [Trichormus variabilis FACHB-164]RUS94033.1 hypothetical protein DSM107003_39200 [Trichormus variabilis SAG 1403-4b]